MRLFVGFLCAVMAVACGDENKVRHLPDAPPPPDAEVDAAPFGPVTLTIFEGTSPQVGIPVIFQNADSTVVLETTTGTDGKASAMMMPGGYVTAIEPFRNLPQGGPAYRDLRTFAGVKPGDQLRLFQEDYNSQSIDVTIVLPIASNAFEYRVSTNCMSGFGIGSGGSASQPMATMQLSGCGPTSNLLVEAIGPNAEPVASIYKPSVALTANGTIDLTAETYTAVPDVSFAYSNIPANTTSVSVTTVRATSLGRIFETGDSAPVLGNSVQLTAKVPVISNATAITASTLYRTQTHHLITEWGPPATSYALDIGASLLPDFTSDANLDIAGHKITWTQSGGAVQPDFVLLTAFLGREVPNQRWAWTIVAPGTTQAVLPVLPSAFATYNPITDDFANYDLRTGKVPGGYDAVRANILATEGLDQVIVGAAGKAHFNNLLGFKLLPKPASTSVFRGLRQR